MKRWRRLDLLGIVDLLSRWNPLNPLIPPPAIHWRCTPVTIIPVFQNRFTPKISINFRSNSSLPEPFTSNSKTIPLNDNLRRSSVTRGQGYTIRGLFWQVKWQGLKQCTLKHSVCSPNNICILQFCSELIILLYTYNNSVIN